MAMKISRKGVTKGSMRTFIVCVVMATATLAVQIVSYGQSRRVAAPDLRGEAEQLFALANQARAASGAPPLRWDPDLADSALMHCRRMAIEGPIAHRYGGEPSVTARAAQAGAHFSLLEENVAVGPSAEVIHNDWMHSPGHRKNLLNPKVDHVGIAVVEAHDVLYAVADYSRAIPALTPPQVEARVSRLLSVSGIKILNSHTEARAYCNGVNHPTGARFPGFLMRWQGPDIEHLPQQLVNNLGSGQFHAVEVGACQPRNVEGSFTVYRVAVLLY